MEYKDEQLKMWISKKYDTEIDLLVAMKYNCTT